MQEFMFYAGGEFRKSSTPLPVINSYNNETIGTTWLAGKEDLDFSIEKARAVLPLMRDLPVWKKHKILMQIASELEKQKSRVAEILSREACKPLKYAIGETERAIQTFIVAAEEAKRFSGESLSIDWTPAGEGKTGIVKPFPVGLIAGIAPFNFPLNLSVHKIAPALAAGNCIILKPARSTPLSVLILAEIISQTDLPPGAVSILPMDRIAGQQLITDPRFNMLTFTGSPEAGWKMKEQAGKKKVALELGGNAGVIVTLSANLPLAVSKCLTGAFAYSGQVCIHTQRIYIQESVFDKFCEQFTEASRKMVAGPPDAMSTDFSAMIDEENAIRVEAWVREAADNGAKILAGGKRSGTLVEPTVLTGTGAGMKVCKCEVFGPVVVLEKYKAFKDAVEMINDTEFGLQAGVFTDSLEEMNLAFREIEAGGIIINDVPTFRVDHMPYGGIKNSGYGREGVRYAMQEMSEPKLLVRNQ